MTSLSRLILDDSRLSLADSDVLISASSGKCPTNKEQHMAIVGQ